MKALFFLQINPHQIALAYSDTMVQENQQQLTCSQDYIRLMKEIFIVQFFLIMFSNLLKLQMMDRNLIAIMTNADNLLVSALKRTSFSLNVLPTRIFG